MLYIFAIPNVAYGLVTMSNYFYPMSFFQIKAISLVILLIWFGTSFVKVKLLGRAQNIMFWLMVIISAYVSVSFIMNSQWSYSTLTPWFPQGITGFGAAVGILVFKYIGFDFIPQLLKKQISRGNHIGKLT